MAEPDFYKVDEAARRLCSYDQGHDIDPEVWANDTPESERQDYRSEAYRYALVAEVMNAPTDPSIPDTATDSLQQTIGPT